MAKITEREVGEGEVNAGESEEVMDDTSVRNSKLSASTPGPWRVKKMTKNWIIQARGRLGGENTFSTAETWWNLGTMRGGAPGDGNDVGEANAKLIACAPVMLDAIRYYATIDGPVGVMAKGILKKLDTGTDHALAKNE